MRLANIRFLWQLYIHLWALTLSSWRWSNSFLNPSQNSRWSQYTGYCNWNNIRVTEGQFLIIRCQPAARKLHQFSHLRFLDHTHSNNSVTPSGQCQNLLEKHICSSTYRRKKYEWAPNAPRSCVVQRPDLTVIIIYYYLEEEKQRGWETQDWNELLQAHPGLLLQNICRSVNLTIFKTLSNQTVFYFSPQLSSLRLFTKQWCSWSQNYKHCQTKWCQRQHSTRCLLRAHPSADTKSASTGNSELCCFYSDWVHFRNCNTKITSFLKKRAESQKDGTLWSENADGDHRIIES